MANRPFLVTASRQFAAAGLCTGMPERSSAAFALNSAIAGGLFAGSCDSGGGNSA